MQRSIAFSEQSYLDAEFSTGETPAIRSAYATGQSVRVDFSQATGDDYSTAIDVFVSGFVYRRYETPAIAGRTGAARPLEDDPEPDAVVAYADDLALLLGRCFHGKKEWAEGFYLARHGSTIHPAGFQICACKTIAIPRPIMLELVSKPRDPRQLFVLAAAVVPLSGARTRPRLVMTWVCGHDAEHAVSRWQASDRGLRGLATQGERAAVITSILLPRSDLEWTLRHPPIKED